MNRRFARKVSVLLVVLMVIMMMPSQAFAEAGKVWRQSYEVKDFNVLSEWVQDFPITFNPEMLYSARPTGPQQTYNPHAIRLDGFKDVKVGKTVLGNGVEGPVSQIIYGVLKNDLDGEVELVIETDDVFKLVLDDGEDTVINNMNYLITDYTNNFSGEGIPFELRFFSTEDEKNKIKLKYIDKSTPLLAEAVEPLGEDLEPSGEDLEPLVLVEAETFDFEFDSGDEPRQPTPRAPELESDEALLEAFLSEMENRFGAEYYSELFDFRPVLSAASHGYSNSEMPMTANEKVMEVWEYVTNFYDDMDDFDIDVSKRGFLNVKHYNVIDPGEGGHDYSGTTTEEQRHEIYSIETYEGWKVQDPYMNNMDLSYYAEYDADFYEFYINGSGPGSEEEYGEYFEKNKGSLYFQYWNNSDAENPANVFFNALVMAGYFVPEKTGNYNLRAVTDDGIYGVLTNDGDDYLFADDWVYQSPQKSEPVNGKPLYLYAGKIYPIYIEFFENKLDDASFVLTMDFESGDPINDQPGLDFENRVVPASYLYPYAVGSEPEPELFRDPVVIETATFAGFDVTATGTGPADEDILVSLDGDSATITVASDGTWTHVFENVEPTVGVLDNSTEPVETRTEKVRAVDTKDPLNKDKMDVEIPEKWLEISSPNADFYIGGFTVTIIGHFIEMVDIEVDNASHSDDVDMTSGETTIDLNVDDPVGDRDVDVLEDGLGSFGASKTFYRRDDVKIKNNDNYPEETDRDDFSFKVLAHSEATLDITGSDFTVDTTPFDVGVNGKGYFDIDVTKMADGMITVTATDQYEYNGLQRSDSLTFAFDYIIPIIITDPINYLIQGETYALEGDGESGGEVDVTSNGLLAYSELELAVAGGTWMTSPINAADVETITFTAVQKVTRDPFGPQTDVTYEDTDTHDVEIRAQVEITTPLDGAYIVDPFFDIEGEGTANSKVKVFVFNGDDRTSGLRRVLDTDDDGDWILEDVDVSQFSDPNINILVIDKPDGLFERNRDQIEVELPSLTLENPMDGDTVIDGTVTVDGTVTGNGTVVVTVEALDYDVFDPYYASYEHHKVELTVGDGIDDTLDKWSLDVDFSLLKGNDFKIHVDNGLTGTNPLYQEDEATVKRQWKPIVIEAIDDFSYGVDGAVTISGTGERSENMILRFTGISDSDTLLVPVDNGTLNEGDWSYEMSYFAPTDYDVEVTAEYEEEPKQLESEEFIMNYVDPIEATAGSRVEAAPSLYEKFLDINGSAEDGFTVEALQVFPTGETSPKMTLSGDTEGFADPSFDINDLDISKLPSGLYEVSLDYVDYDPAAVEPMDRLTKAEFFVGRYPVMVKNASYDTEEGAFKFRVKGDPEAEMNIEIFFTAPGGSEEKVYPESGSHQQVMDQSAKKNKHDFTIPFVPWLVGDYRIVATDLGTPNDNDSELYWDDIVVTKEVKDPVVIENPVNLQRVGDTEMVSGTSEPLRPVKLYYKTEQELVSGEEMAETVASTVVWLPLFTESQPAVQAEALANDYGQWSVSDVTLPLNPFNNGDEIIIRAVDDEGDVDVLDEDSDLGVDEVGVYKSVLFITSPDNGTIVDYSVVVTGEMEPGSNVQLSVEGGPAFTVNAGGLLADSMEPNDTWSFDFPLESLDDGEIQIKAQDLNNPMQQDWVTVNKYTDVTVTSPVDQSVVTRSFTLTGTSRAIPSGEDELTFMIDGVSYPNAGLIRTDGVNWELEVYYDGLVNGPIQVVVTDPMYPEKSDSKEYHFIGYVDIQIPVDGSTVSSNSMLVSGIAVPNHFLTVTVEGTGTTLTYDSVVVSESGQWSLGTISISGFSNGGLVITATDDEMYYPSEETQDMSYYSQDVHNVTKSVTTTTTTTSRRTTTTTTTEETVLIEDDVTPLGAVEFLEPYIKGFPDGMFKATNGLTRAQTAAIFARILDLNLETPRFNGYSDLMTTEWSYDYVLSATDAGLFSGYDDGTFRGNEFVTRGELADIITNYWAYLGTEVDTADAGLTDIASHWAKDSINQLFNAGVINSFDGTTYSPDEDTSREDAVVMINRLIARPGYDAEDSTFPDITKHRKTFGDIEAASRYYQK